MAHILVVDDDPTNTKLLQFLLTDEGYDVTVANNATVALAQASETAFDLLLLDIMMPGMDGIELCRRIRETSLTPIIFLSAKGEVRDKVIGLEAGGDDYIAKPFDPNEALARVAAALRRSRQRAKSGPMLDTPDLALDAVENTVTIRRTGKTVNLTPIEAKLLRTLLDNPGRTLPRDMLIIKVWGYDDPSASNNLDVYMRRIRNKVEEDPSQPQLIQTIRGVGFRYQPSTAVRKS